MIDSQPVRAADTVPWASRGWDNAEKDGGRKRHIAVDATGLVLAWADADRRQARHLGRQLKIQLEIVRKRDAHAFEVLLPLLVANPVPGSSLPSLRRLRRSGPWS